MNKFFAAILILFSFTAHAQISNDNLVLWLPFNGDATDKSGNNYNGVVNGATLSTGADNQSNTAYYFNGIDNSIVIPNITKLDGKLKAFTILIRMQPQDLYRDPIVQPPFGTAFNFLTWHRNSSDSLNAFLNSKMRTAWQPPEPGSAEPGKDFLSYIMTWCTGNMETASGYEKDTDKVNNQWLTVAYVYNSDTLRIYHNCKVVNDWIDVYPQISDLCGSDPMQISLGNVPQGAFQYGYRYFKGKIDELRIYTRPLTEDEVKFFADTLCDEKIPVVITPAMQVKQDPCYPNQFSFENTSIVTGTVTDSIKWQISTGDSANTNNFSYRFNETGTYTVILTQYVADSAYTIDSTIAVTTLQRLKFLKGSQASIEACEGSSINLSVQGGNTYEWQPCYNLNTCTEAVVTALVDSNITYTITATDLNACKDTAQISLKKLPDENKVYIPTAFTPNNDGLNDKFGVKSDMPLSDFHLNIYNRWGKVIFSSNNQNKKWDGLLNSITLPSGVYVWLLTYKNAQGCLNRKLHGTIVLMR
jgi:gliding motility-associated-like protein